MIYHLNFFSFVISSWIINVVHITAYVNVC